MQPRQQGVSIIEVLVAIAIMTILFALGLPSFSTYLANTKLRATAESFLAGTQQARSEAVRRNDGVQFVLTSDPPVAANVATVVPAANGNNWMIRTADLSSFIEGKAGAETTGGSLGATSLIQINSGGISAITFNGFGASNVGATATFRFTYPSAGNCADNAQPGPIRCLNVVVSVGGTIRMCDPKVTAVQTAAGDTRGC